jgi:iron-sulfur cluster assembly accessory protein
MPPFDDRLLMTLEIDSEPWYSCCVEAWQWAAPTAFNEVIMPLELTSKAVSKVKEILDQQEPKPLGLRVSVVGGGCSGFSYQMNFENQTNGIDKTYDFEGLKVFVDQASLMYLNGTKIDYLETLEGAGFKFENPNVKSTCGCGSSFSV